MKKIKKYTADKTYMFPNGAIATPEEVLHQFPAATIFAHIFETDENEQMLFSMENLSAVRTMMDIDPALSEEDAISEIERLRNEPEPLPDQGVTSEERIAAALEFQNLLSM